MPDTFVIKIKHGGLGDHLFYSHLPRIAKQSCGFKRVLISNVSEYRHADYKRLVWEANPFVDGFTDEDAPFPGFDRVPKGTNLLDHIMILRGLDDGKRFHEPELFFKPEKISSLAGTTVYDPNYVSNVGSLEAEHVERYFARKRIVPDFMLQPRAKGVTVKRYGSLLETKNLEHYCSVMASAKRFICLTSGGATLAAALGVPVVALWGNGQWIMFHHSRLHKYVNVNPIPFRQRCQMKFNEYIHPLRVLRRRSVGAVKKCFSK
jgi:hypothetical protein